MAERQLLIIEDDPGLLSQMRWCFDGINVATAIDAKSAITSLRKNPPQVITLDLGLPPDPGGSEVGFALLEEIQRLLPRTKIIVITGRDDRASALTSISRGAYDFYNKPIEAATLSFVVERAFRMYELEDENRKLSNFSIDMPLDGLVAQSEVMQSLARQVERVAPSDISVLLAGETGTGKEVIAQALHSLSPRKNSPFVAINCAAIPENLLESELFGHEKGAFTGASRRKEGRIQAADGGTLFLDEIGDMPLSLQAKLLRFAQDRRIERLGSNRQIAVDLRIISATHQNLARLIEAGRFREDLYFRLGEITLTLPPLRDRSGDSLLLAKYMIRKFAGDRTLRLSNEAANAIEHWHWPGNVREIENRIKRACVMTDTNTITPLDLELVEVEAEDDRLPLNLQSVRASAERDAILRALTRVNHNVSKAARLLGVSRPTLYNLFEKYAISINEEQHK
jgi:two-component system NtrC family response regulator